MVEQLLRERRPIYGVSTGVGELCTVSISPADAQTLQRNIVRSHAAGVGASLPEPAVRAMMVLRANALASGYSGVRPLLIDRLLELLNRGVHPLIPEQRLGAFVAKRWDHRPVSLPHTGMRSSGGTTRNVTLLACGDFGESSPPDMRSGHDGASPGSPSFRGR